HGKTTTTGMMVDLLEREGVSFSYLLGASFADGRAPARWEDSKWLLAEVDESDRTIDRFDPEITLWLNADHDHHSQYATEEDYLSVFENLVRRTKVVAFTPTESALDGGGARVESVGDGGDWTWRNTAKNTVAVSGRGERVEIELNRSGVFNFSNFAYCVGACREVLGKMPQAGSLQLSAIDRRQSCRYVSPEIRVLDDYAHHPAEIRALLESVECEDRKKVVVFQPHRYSRTARLKAELAESLKGCDRLYLLEVYAASEDKSEGEGASALAAQIGDEDFCVLHENGDDSLFEALRKEVEGSIDFIFLGAGRTDALAKAFAADCAEADARWGEVFEAFGQQAVYDSKIVRAEPLAKKTTLRVGGEAELYCEPRSLGELTALLRTCARLGRPVAALGRGSNVIVPDGGVEGIVIRLQERFWRRYEKRGDSRLRVGAGMRIKELCGLACRLELAGFEFLEGIPGSLGGALRMNAGAMGGWMFDVVEEVTYVTMEGEVIACNAENMTVGYRHCKELQDAIAVEAVLKAGGDAMDQKEIRAAIDTYQGKRKESQPREPSAGCIFKNPEGDSAGRLIDELGLKGTAIGGARISEVHGNFIVNTGGASSQDVIDLVKLARRVAMKEKQVDLEPEALLYGGSWREVLSQ
ncbi:MAG: UDP-N-acetylmuramate dehydrogenase, partial [Verrucomicrobiota bacterium]